MRALILVSLVILSACGKVPPTNSLPVLDPNACPFGAYGAQETITFVSDLSSLQVEDALCSSSGTFSCDAESRTINFTITDLSPSWGMSENDCTQKGSYSCEYTYQVDDRGFISLVLDCGAGLNIYETARFE